MATIPKIADWVAETTNTIGTGDIQLTGQLTGFNPFSVIGDETVYYTIQEGFDKEIGIGVIDSSKSVLKRTKVIATIINNKYSNNGSPMTLKGYAEVFCTISTDLINKIVSAIGDSDKSIGDLKKLVEQMKTKLDTIEENAKDDQNASEVPVSQDSVSELPDNVQAALEALWNKPSGGGSIKNTYHFGTYTCKSAYGPPAFDDGFFAVDGDPAGPSGTGAPPGSSTSLYIGLGRGSVNAAKRFPWYGISRQDYYVIIVDPNGDNVYDSYYAYSCKQDDPPSSAFVSLNLTNDYDSSYQGGLKVEPNKEYDLYFVPKASAGGSSGPASLYPVLGEYTLGTSRNDAKVAGGAYNSGSRNLYVNYKNSDGVDISKDAKAALNGQNRKVYIDMIDESGASYHLACDGLFFTDSSNYINFDLAKVGSGYPNMPNTRAVVRIVISIGEPNLPAIGEAYARIREQGESDKLIAIDHFQTRTPFWLGYFEANLESAGSTNSYRSGFGYTDASLAPGSKFRLSTNSNINKSVSAGLIGLQGQKFTLVIASESGYDWKMVDAVFDDTSSMNMPGFTLSAYTGVGDDSSNWSLQSGTRYQVSLIPKGVLMEPEKPPEGLTLPAGSADAGAVYEYQLEVNDGSGPPFLGFYIGSFGSITPNEWHKSSGLSKFQGLYFPKSGGNNMEARPADKGVAHDWEGKNHIAIEIGGVTTYLFIDDGGQVYKSNNSPEMRKLFDSNKGGSALTMKVQGFNHDTIELPEHGTAS